MANYCSFGIYVEFYVDTFEGFLPNFFSNFEWIV